MCVNVNKRPVLIRGSEAPIVIREGKIQPPLVCGGCKESTLIENYLAECFVGIGFQCFKCSHITWTPSLPQGEIFPQMPLSLGREGIYLIGSSVVNKQDVVMTCDQEIEAASKLTAPSDDSGNNLELSLENLNLISTELDILSGGRFNKYLDSAKRSLLQKSIYFRENPLAWSIELIKDQLSRNELQMNKQTLVALGFLQGYRNILERWKGHVHFPLLAIEICATFYHSLIQLVAASYLVDNGNKIAFNFPEKEDGERSADLYLRLSGREKLFLEIKGPESLEWTNSDVSNGKMKKAIEDCLSNSRGQIDNNSPGILIIGTTCLNDGFLSVFKKVVGNVLKSRGKDYPAVAGISIVGLKEISVKRRSNSGGRVSTAFDVSMTNNKYYFKDNPIRS